MSLRGAKQVYPECNRREAISLWHSSEIYEMLYYGIGAIFRMELKRKRALAIEIGMQNAGLGTTLALDHFGEKAAIPAAIFVFICIITASVMAELWQKTATTAVKE